jgi:eukaryotic-like serine/threonine-protein kinase
MSEIAADAREDRLEEAVFKYLQAVDRGEGPDREEWLKEYPDLRQELEEFFVDDRQLKTLAEPLCRDLPDLCGSRVGEYELEEVIGIGGMGIVFRARPVKGNFKIALKMLFGGTDTAWVQRFVRETELHSRLNHAHIVPVYFVGEHEGLPYFTMKLAEAGTLKNHLDRFGLARRNPKIVKGKGAKLKRWSRAMIRERAKRIARLMAHVAEAVHHAHQHSLLHRDLKPGNILIDGKEHPYVADFGLVMRIEEGGTGGIEGTPPYMAPEQARGTGALSTAVDVYGLGAVLYELLTGRPPFTGASTTEILEGVRTQEPARPSRLRPGVPHDLEAICLKCLHKNPQKRYSSARQVAGALNDFIEGKPPRGIRTPAWRRAAMWVLRKPGVAALAASLVLATSLALGTWAERYRTAVAARQHAENDLYRRSIPEAYRYLSGGYLDRAEEILDGCPTDLRHFEWRLLKRWCQADAVPLSGHADLILDIAFRPPGGGAVATAGKDGTVRLWDTRTGNELRTLERRKQPATSLAFSQDGRYLVTAGPDRVVRVWEFSPRGPTNVLQVKGEARVAITRDGRSIASAGQDHKVRVWDVRTGRTTHVLEYQGEVFSLAFSPDAGWLAAGGQSSGEKTQPLKVWHMPGGGESRDFPVALLSKDWIRALAFSPDGRHLIVATGSTARIWDIGGKKEAGFLPGYQRWATGLAFDETGRYLAGSFQTGTIRVWDRAHNNKVVFSARRATAGPITSVSLDPQGRRVAYPTGKEATVERWQVRGGIRSVTGHCLAFSPRGSHLALASGRSVEVQDLAAGGARRTLRGHTGRVTWMAFDPEDGNRLSTASEDGTVRLWDLNTGQEIQDGRQKHKGPVRCVAFGLGNLLASSTGKDGTVRVWHATTGQQIFVHQHGEAVRCLAFSPDGKHLATACQDWVVRVFDLATGAVRRQRDPNGLPVTCVAFSPDGRWLAAGSEDQTVRLWDMRAEMRPGTELRHDLGVLGLSFSPDGRRLATASQDGHVRLWDIATGQELLTLTRETLAATWVAFSPHRHHRLLAVLGADGRGELWEGAAE